MAGIKDVLIVEDDKSIIEMYETLFEHYGYDVTSVFYKDTQEIPRDKFYGAIVDGLGGDWKQAPISLYGH